MSMLRVRRQIQGSPLVVCMVSCQQILQIYSSIWKTSYRPASDISSTHFPVEHHVSPALLPKVLHTLLHGSRHATLTPPPLSMGTAFVTVTHPHSLLTTLLLLQKKHVDDYIWGMAKINYKGEKKKSSFNQMYTRHYIFYS